MEAPLHIVYIVNTYKSNTAACNLSFSNTKMRLSLLACLLVFFTSIAHGLPVDSGDSAEVTKCTGTGLDSCVLNNEGDESVEEESSEESGEESSEVSGEESGQESGEESGEEDSGEESEEVLGEVLYDLKRYSGFRIYGPR